MKVVGIHSTEVLALGFLFCLGVLSVSFFILGKVLYISLQVVYINLYYVTFPCMYSTVQGKVIFLKTR